MKRTWRLNAIRGMLVLCAVLLVALSGCKSGGSSSSGPEAGAEGTGYGKVGILLTDGPADEYDHIWVTVTEVSLLPSGDSEDRDAVVIFKNTKGYEFDLLSYRDEDFLLTLNESVPVGRYEKIRLKVSKVWAEGGPCEDMTIDVPSGKIDLNPRSPIVVQEDTALYIRLDIDANKSINLHTTGSGVCKFRPVVFVDILAQDAPPTCPVMVKGKVAAIEDVNSDTKPDFLILEREDPLRTVRVKVWDDTDVFNKDGVFGSLADIHVGDTATVRGLVKDCHIEASLVILGESLALKGMVIEPVTATSFGLTPDVGEALTGTYNVVLAPETPIVTRCDEPVDPDMITAGMRVIVAGKYNADTDKFLAALVLVKPREVEGTITAVAGIEGGYSYTILKADNTSEVVNITGNYTVFIEGDGLVEPDMMALLSFIGCHARIVERADLTEVTITPERLSGEVTAVEFFTRTLTVDGLKVKIMPLATGMDIVAEDYSLIPFADIEVGDEITCFGFDGREGGLIDFFAFAYLVSE